MVEHTFRSHGQEFVRESHIIKSKRFATSETNETPPDPESLPPSSEIPLKSPLEQLQEDLRKTYKTPKN